MLRCVKSSLLLLGLTAVLSGCATSKVTNLTPAKLPRRPDNSYTVEAVWTSRDATVRYQTMKPQVMIGQQFYPMRPVPVVRNRWESIIPVPAGEKKVRYRFKFDYDYNAIPVPLPGSVLSPEYTLEIK